MSIVTVFKEADVLILSSDSRAMVLDNSTVDSDTEQKIFAIAPGTFIATSGRTGVGEFQLERARKIAADLNTTDIQVIARELARASVPALKMLLERLRKSPGGQCPEWIFFRDTRLLADQQASSGTSNVCSGRRQTAPSNAPRKRTSMRSGSLQPKREHRLNYLPR
jgi:hypothetical protein